MFGLFKCNHPFKYIHVRDSEFTERINADFDRVTYHLYCRKCNEKLPLSYARMVGSTKEFLNRR